MLSRDSSARAGQLSELAKITKHPVLETNGPGDPRIAVSDVEPGSVILFGTDDDVTCLVLGNFASEFNTGEGKKPARTLLLFGCYNEPGTWGEGRLFSQQFNLKETVSVLFEPGMF